MNGAIVLAAGASQRMGAPKALLPWRTNEAKSFLVHILRLLDGADVSAQVVVLGPPHGQAIRATILPSLQVAWNEQPGRGMLSSVQAAVPLLPDTIRGTLVWPVDMPFVQLATVQRILFTAAAAANSGGNLVIPTHDGRGGHPIWVPRQLFGELMDLSPEVGLRALRQAHSETRLPVDDAGVLCDVDTPEALAVVRRRLGGSSHH